jgi:hypothetical protein
VFSEGDESGPARLAAEQQRVRPERLVPVDAAKEIGDLAAGALLSRNTVDQRPYLDLLASQLGIEDRPFPIALHTHDAWPDLDSFVTTVVIWLTIRREPPLNNLDWIDHFARYMDPAKWSDVAPDFFKGSEVLSRTTEDEETGSWTGSLSEKVSWALNDAFTSRIHNRLGVDFMIDRDAERLRVGYWLIESISSDVAGSYQRGGLDVDEGEVVMWPSDDEQYFYVYATKKVRFVNRDAAPLPGGVDVGEFMNFMAPASVGLWMDQLVFQTALGAIRTAVEGSPPVEV